MKTILKIKKYKASPEAVFDCIDDLGVTGMHMTESSMPMMGGKMDLEFLTPHKTGLHTKVSLDLKSFMVDTRFYRRSN